MRKTIQEIEQEIAFYELVLSCRNVDKYTWNDTVSKYNAAKIKLSQMKGEQPQVIHYNPEHIINK
ncbi:hypothetical protein [Dysgonomonas sp. Marseille-P4361]|uniref:hypothetical protein n=1 Tax=Dysgonomonas sp. Marseille-P4361 TaxID=2161820 RepID=UPI000D560002|nr:hypothetical protein [Dysgonomonas sp. Marseille-P4361]